MRHFFCRLLFDPITNQISLSEISKKMRNNRISIFSTTLICNTLCFSVQSPCAVKAQALLKKRNALRFCRWVARVIRAMSDLKKWYRCLRFSRHLTQKYHMSYTKPNIQNRVVTRPLKSIQTPSTILYKNINIDHFLSKMEKKLQMRKTVPDTSKYTYNSSLLIIFIISVSAYPVSTIIHKLPELKKLPHLNPILYNI